MRRSTVVRLTLLPMLAAAAVASADDAPTSDPSQPTLDTTFAPPGMSEEVLTPPGMTAPVDCDQDPQWREREDCDVVGVTIRGGVVRGGFGHYFWAAGG